MVVLTVKIKHKIDFSEKLEKAYQVARFAIANRDLLSTKHVASIGLPSSLSNQTLRKYGKNRKCKSVDRQHVKLIVPNQSIKLNNNIVKITCLKLEFEFNYSEHQYTKINQIEIDNEYFYIAIEAEEPELIAMDSFIGVDLNSTGHAAVAANPITGKVLKLGSQLAHVKSKYKNLRRKYQSEARYRDLKAIKGREKNIVKDLNHKIANAILAFAMQQNCGVALERLTNIRKNCTVRFRKKTNHSLNTWSFACLQAMLCYKAKLLGIPVRFVNPYNTSKCCSRCHKLGTRDCKKFNCPHCGHFDHADANAAFNISLAPLWTSAGSNYTKTEIGIKGTPLISLESSTAEQERPDGLSAAPLEPLVL